MNIRIFTLLPIFFSAYSLDAVAAGQSYGFTAEHQSSQMEFSFGDWRLGSSEYFIDSVGFGGMSPYSGSNPAENFLESNSAISGQFSYDTRENTAVQVNRALYREVDFSLNLQAGNGSSGRFGVDSSTASAGYEDDFFQQGAMNDFRLSGYGVSGVEIAGGNGCGFEIECWGESFQFSIYQGDSIINDHNDVFDGVYSVDFSIAINNDMYVNYDLEEVGLHQVQYSNNVINHSLSPISTEEQTSGNLDLNFKLNNMMGMDAVRVEVIGMGADSECVDIDMCLEEGSQAYQNKKAEIENFFSEVGLSVDLGVSYKLTGMEELSSGGSALDPILPNIDGKAANEFIFSINVNSEELTFIDPEVAVGYDYKSIEGADFLAVLLPEGFGDNLYDLWLFNEGVGEFVDSGVDLVGGQVYEFDQNGLNLFRILGIETDDNLDPNDPEAFVTGLKFVSGGEVTMSQTALTQTVVPVPPSILFFMTGIVGLYFRKLV